MNGAFLTGFLIFCSLWALGSFLKQCSSCKSSISYDDCQSNVSVNNCDSASETCYQADIQYTKSDDKKVVFQKGCVLTNLCANYSKGIIGGCLELVEQGYTGSCKAMCCSGNNCNNGNLLLESSTTKATTSTTKATTSTTKPTTNTGVAFVISVMVLFSGFLLTLLNFN